MIEVTGLHKAYGPKVAVDDVSFTVERGEIFGILGPNGAGKTTTVECVVGLRTPDRGRISVLGLNPQQDHGELRELVGVRFGLEGLRVLPRARSVRERSPQSRGHGVDVPTHGRSRAVALRCPSEASLRSPGTAPATALSTSRVVMTSAKSSAIFSSVAL